MKHSTPYARVWHVRHNGLSTTTEHGSMRATTHASLSHAYCHLTLDPPSTLARTVSSLDMKNLESAALAGISRNSFSPVKVLQ